jgi:hypothetical protein
VDAHAFQNKLKKLKQSSSARKLMATVLGQEKIANGGVHAIRKHNYVRSALQNTRKIKLYGAIQNKRCGMLTYSVVPLNENALLHTAACTLALREHFNSELFDHPPYSRDLGVSDYHLFTCLKNWLGSQRFNNNEELMEGIKT